MVKLNFNSPSIYFKQVVFGFFSGPYLEFFDRGYSFERNCELRRWESETLK